MRAQFLTMLCLAFARLLAAQAFELTFGDASGAVIDKGFRLLQVPNEHAYLVFSQRNGGPGDGIVVTKVNDIGNIVWEKTDSVSMPIFNLITATANDGLWVAYEDFNLSTNWYDLNIKKYNFEGEVVSEHIYALPEYTIIENMFFFPDYSVGCIASLIIPGKASLFKVSKNAELLWSKIFPNYDLNVIYIEPDQFTFTGTPDGGFLITTFVEDQTFFTKVSKFDAQGNLQWQNQGIPYTNHDQIIAMPLLQGGGQLIWRITALGFASKLYKIDGDGLLLWEKDFFAHANDHGSHMSGEDNSYYIYGSVRANNIITPCLLRLDENGEVLWEKRYDTNLASGSGKLVRVGDGGFFVAITKNPTSGSLNAPYAIKTDASGEIAWSWSNTTYDRNYQQVQPLVSSYGEYLMLGIFHETFIDDYENLLVRLEFLSAVQPDAMKPSFVNIFPQPANGDITFRLKDNLPNGTTLEIFNLLGQRIRTQAVKAGDNHVSGLPAGQHFYRLRQNGEVLATGKVVVVSH